MLYVFICDADLMLKICFLLNIFDETMINVLVQKNHIYLKQTSFVTW